MTPSPTPTFVPQNATEAQQLQLLNHIQSNTLTNTDGLLAFISLGLPLPMSWKLNIYTFLTTLPLPELSPMWITVIVAVGPILTITLLYFLVRYGLQFIRFLVPFILSKFAKHLYEKKFLELTFPHDTDKSAYATKQLYTLIHTLARQKKVFESLLKQKTTFSLEIVSTKKYGIRYIMAVPPKNADVIKRSLISYLPGIKTREIEDYLKNDDDNKDLSEAEFAVGIADIKLAEHFALPLQKQKVEDEHDLISYLTGGMTKLKEGETIVFQIVTTPILTSIHGDVIGKISKLRFAMQKSLPLAPLVQQNDLQKFAALPVISIFVFFLKIGWKLFSFICMFAWSMILAFMDSSGKSVPFLMTPEINIPKDLLNPYEIELKTVVKEKIEQQLFESSIRILVMTRDREEFVMRMSGLTAAFGPLTSTYQSLVSKGTVLPNSIALKHRLTQLKTRVLSTNTPFNPNPILSASEISELYHFPFANSSRTEDMVKLHSKELPAPLSLKGDDNLDVIFAKNTYGDSDTAIGLTREERRRHMYILGATGTGKSTMMLSMINEDLKHGEGLAVVDPHGELAEDILSCIPKDRIKDVIYFNPDDLEYPIGLNLMELTPGLSTNDQLREKEFIAESIISLFRKVFGDGLQGNPHRIEYILRNTIHTAFTLPNPTLFTIYDLLNDPDFRKESLKHITDKRLLKFWKNEFGRAGNWQEVKMISPVTARIGRFLFSPSAKRILEQDKSTINFDQIMDTGKIFICNLSKGRLGEDTAQVLGITILNKIQLAALKRARTRSAERRDFYLYVDEFQHFATNSFVGMLSEARKYKLNVVIAEQSTSQQNDTNLVNVILANVGTVAMFKSANPDDEDRILPQFAPYVKKGEILNLPAYRFYIKIGALHPEEPFSGTTIPVEIKRDDKRLERIIQESQKRYASIYQNKEKEEVANKLNIEKKIPKQVKKIEAKKSSSKRYTKPTSRGIPDQTTVQ
jgi:hypothetical protein